MTDKEKMLEAVREAQAKNGGNPVAWDAIEKQCKGKGIKGNNEAKRALRDELKEAGDLSRSEAGWTARPSTLPFSPLGETRPVWANVGEPVNEEPF
jgi:hypothetical protein